MSGTLGTLFSLAFTHVGIDSIFSVVPSLVGCAVICLHDPSCASIFYHQETYKCYLSSTVYRQTSPSLVPVPGMQHYHSDRCPPGSTLITSEAVCVTVFPRKVTYSEADVVCRSNSFAGNNYRLVTFRTKSKHDELTQYLDKVLDIPAVWTGLADETGSSKWTWEDGSEAVYLPWAPQEPSSPVAALSGTMPASGVMFGLAASNVGIDAIFTIVPSLIACVVVCTQDRPCVSVFYQEETHKCYLSSTVYRPTSPELLSVPGMQHYHSDRCPPGSTIMTSDFVCVTVYAWNLGKIAADGKCRKYSFAGNNYRLITFKTKSKYDELTQYLDSVSKNITGTWTGLIYGIRSAKWTWQDGSYALYLPWDRNEPSRPRVEQCTLLIRRFNWKMHDYTCKRARSVACEVSANI